MHGRMGRQHRSNQCAVTAADVDQGVDSGEVIGAEQRLGNRDRLSCHESIEASCELGIAIDVVEEPGMPDVIEGGFAGLDAVHEFAPSLPIGGGAIEDRAMTQ